AVLSRQFRHTLVAPPPDEGLLHRAIDRRTWGDRRSLGRRIADLRRAGSRHRRPGPGAAGCHQRRAHEGNESGHTIATHQFEKRRGNDYMSCRPFASAALLLIAIGCVATGLAASGKTQSAADQASNSLAHDLFKELIEI